MGIKKKHGGKRTGAGRPKLKPSEKKEKTVVKRIPLSYWKKYQDFINGSSGGDGV